MKSSNNYPPKLHMVLVPEFSLDMPFSSGLQGRYGEIIAISHIILFLLIDTYCWEYEWFHRTTDEAFY